MSGSSSGTPGGIKLFVGALPDTVTEVYLHHIFSQYGTVKSVHLITDSNTGVFKGCAFVTFSERSSGENAIRALNNTAQFVDVSFFLSNSVS